VAATLTADQELVYASFPISKTEELPDGNLIVYGKATDGTVDSDRQVVDVSWSATALKQWLDTGGNVRVQHQPQRDPAGKGLQIDVTPDGHWVKSLIVEPVAQRLVRAGVLRAYSVGISRPRIDPDPTGKALGGIIRGNADTQIVEVSLVDRPANKNCGFQLIAKGAGGGLEFTGKMFGETDLLTKDGGGGGGGGGGTATPLTADADSEEEPDYEHKPKPGTAPTDTTMPSETGKAVRYQSVSVELPGDVSVTFSPADLAKLQTFAQQLGAEDAEFQKVADTEEAFLGKEHRKFGARRRKQLAGSGHALPDGSYPIPDKDALRRASVLARSGHGNVAAARRLIARRAKELGVPNPLSENDAVKKDEGGGGELLLEDVSVKAATCDVCKGPGPLTDGKCMKCTGMKSEGEPDAEKAIARMDHDDHDTDSDTDEDEEADKSASASASASVEEPEAKKAKSKPKKGKGGKPPWLNGGGDDDSKDGDEGSDDSNKGGTPADGVTGMSADPVPVHREPDGSAIESFEHDSGMPTVPDASVHGVGKAEESEVTEMDAALRLKSVGVAYQLGVLHDLCCPVFEPGDVAKAHPGASFEGIDLMFFAQKAMDSAAGGSLEEAARATALWTHAQTLKMTGAEGMAALQEEAHKAFRDANPGVSSFPTPGHISPERFRRGSITAGHAADSPGHEGPHTASIPSSGGIHAESFTRGPITSGHEAPSPGNTGKAAGMPSRTEWVPTIRENAAAAMRAMHDHVAQTFPDVCALMPGEPGGIMSRPVPVPQGTPPARAAKVESEEDVVSKAVTAADVTGTVEADVEKARKKLRKKLGKKVLAGKMTVDEARGKIGRNVAQKTGGQTMLGVSGGGGMGMKAEGEAEVLPVAETVKSSSFGNTWTSNTGYVTPPVWIQNGGGGMQPDVVELAVKAAVGPLLEQLEKSEAAQANLLQRLNALEDMPDPNVAAFRGMAVKSAGGRPVGGPSIAEFAEQTKLHDLRQLETEWRTATHPGLREAAWAAMQELIRG
jgi:hypothetical protein